MTQQQGKDFTGADPDEPLVEDLLDETRRPDDHDVPEEDKPKAAREQPDPPATKEVPEPPD
jgi:hypothetical protein